MEKVQTAWESVKEAVSTAIEAIKGFFTGLVDSIKQAWENIKTAISEKIDAIKETVRSSIVNALEKVNDDNNSYADLKKEVIAAKDAVDKDVDAVQQKQ